MSKPLVKRIPFAKIVTVLAVANGVSLGLCGLMPVFSRVMPADESLVELVAMIELGVIILSVIGLVITTVLWVVLAAVGSSSREDSEP
jgi:hypothetical protein